MLNNDVVCYTPETYVEHLQSILRYMKKYPNYSAVLLPYAEDTHALMVKDKRRALMLRPEPSLIVFEVSQPNIADACNEYLLRLAEDSLSVDNYRQVTIEHLESLIHQLRLEV